jgi:hypothetical protein
MSDRLCYVGIPWKEEFEDTKGLIRMFKSKDRQHNGQKKKRSTKHHTEN